MALRAQYTIPPEEALDQNQKILYQEGLNIRKPIYLTSSLYAAAEAEFQRDKQRYRVNQQASITEVYRAALVVFLRLREEDPALFYRLRDSFS